LERQNLTLSVVETFTGGAISQKFTSTGTTSFFQGVVLPSEPSQRHFLGLSFEEFNSLREDSKRFNDSLAKRALNEFKTGFGIAVSGKIYEKHGEEDHRMETYYALLASTGIENQEYSLGGELWMVRERAAIIALDMLRKYLLKITQG